MPYPLIVKMPNTNPLPVYPGRLPYENEDLRGVPIADDVTNAVKGQGPEATLKTKPSRSIFSTLSSKKKPNNNATRVGGNRRQLRSTKRINKLHKSKTYRKKSKTYRKKSKTYRKKS